MTDGSRIPPQEVLSIAPEVGLAIPKIEINDLPDVQPDPRTLLSRYVIDNSEIFTLPTIGRPHESVEHSPEVFIADDDEANKRADLAELCVLIYISEARFNRGEVFTRLDNLGNVRTDGDAQRIVGIPRMNSEKRSLRWIMERVISDEEYGPLVLEAHNELHGDCFSTYESTKPEPTTEQTEVDAIRTEFLLAA